MPEQTKVSLSFKAPIKKKELTSVLGDTEDTHKAPEKERSDAPPLVIPPSTSLSWRERLLQRSQEDQTAVEALMKKEESNDTKSRLVIPEAAPVTTDLPDSSNLDEYQAVPIASFGAALLRGMGWKEGQSKLNDDDAPSLPRPQRLGLGATPAQLPAPTSATRPKSMHQYDKQRKLEAQKQAYQQQHKEQMAADPQRTLQPGSIVVVGDQRVKVVQLTGVPGLNRVRVCFEGEKEATSISKSSLGDLVARSDLQARPFVEPKEEKKESVETKKEKRKREDSEKKDKKKKRKSEKTWAIPHIRVRIVSPKSPHFKSKAVVVDVVLNRLTLQLDNGTLLDGVAERHVTTALPKTGGAVVHLPTAQRATLLERTKTMAVVQYVESQQVQQVLLDDIAEWCGSMEDEDVHF